MPTTYKRQRARQILTQSGGSDDKEEGPSNWVDSQEKSQDTQDEDFQTQGFEYHESDSEQLWEVEEIMEESKGRFLVKWAGTDDRGNPWDNSWVPREDVTDDLVAEWREKKAKEKEKKRKEKAASRRRTVTKSKSPSTGLTSRGSSAVATTYGNIGEHMHLEGQPTTSSLATTSRKRTKRALKSSSVVDSGSEEEERDEPQRKRQKSRSKSGTPVPARTNGTKSLVKDKGKQKLIPDAHPSSPASLKQQNRKSTQTNEGEHNSDRSETESREQDRSSQASATQPRRRLRKDGSLNLSGVTKEYNREPTPPRRSFKPAGSVKMSGRSNLPSNGASIKEKEGSSSSFPGGRKPRLAPPVAAVVTQLGEEEEQSIDEFNEPRVGGGKCEQLPSTSEENRRAASQSPSPPRIYRSNTVSTVRNNNVHETTTVDSPLFEGADAVENSIMDDIGALDGDELLFFHSRTVTPEKLDDKDTDAAPAVTAEPRIPRRSRSATASNIIVPASQSQSQSQSESQNQSSQTESNIDVNPDSMTAQCGSLPLRVSLNGDDDDHYTSTSPLPPAEPQFVISTILPKTFDDVIASDRGEGPSKKGKVPKELKRIPQISPSKFKAYLPVQKRLSEVPAFELPGSANEVAAPTSSIETPQSSSNNAQRDREEGRVSGQHLQSDVDADCLTDDDINMCLSRSLELAPKKLEMAEILRLKEQAKHPEGASRISLENILQESRNRSRTKSPTAIQDTGNSYMGGQLGEANDTHVTTTQSDAVPESSSAFSYLNPDVEAPTALKDDDALFCRFMNFDGFEDAAETYNDQHMLDQSNNHLHREAKLRDRSQNLKNTDIDDPIEDEEEEEDVIAATVSDGRRCSTPITSTTEQQEFLDEDEPFIPHYTKFKIRGSPRRFDNVPVSPLVQTPTRQLNDALGLLNAKSEEIEALKAQLAESERRRYVQDEQIANLKADNAVFLRAHLDKDELEALGDVGRSESEASKEALENALKEKEALAVELALTKASHQDAAKDREHFREAYVKASEYVDGLGKELAESKERLQIAESQVEHSIKLIQRTSRAKEAKLQSELDRAKDLLHILTTRDERTDEEVRRKAAIEPELRVEIRDLKDEVAELRDDLNRVVHQRNEYLVKNHELEDEFKVAQAENKKMENEVCTLQVELARYGARERSVKKMMSRTAPHNAEDFSADAVFVCEWLVEKPEGGMKQCNHVFEEVQDLQDHMFITPDHL